MTRNLWLLALMLCTASWSNNAAAQTTQPTPQQWVFCDGSTALPTGWSASPSTVTVECGPNGAGTAIGADNHLRALLFQSPATRLRTGRYMLTGEGAGGAFAKVFNGYADATSTATRLRILNLGSATSIVNSVVFDWDEAASPNAILDIRGAGVKWLRLERQPDVALGLAAAKTCNQWTRAASVSCANSSASSRVTVSNGATASVTRSFALPAGRYRLATSARGAITVQLTSGPDSNQRYVVLREPITTSGSSFANLSRLFTASGQEVTLSITATSANTRFDFKDVVITPYTEATPSPAVLAAERPSPWPARGINSPDAAQSMSPAPLDRAGNPCTRFPADSNNALFEMKNWGAQIARMTVSTTGRVVRAGCQLLAPTDIYADGSMNRDRFWADAWPRILSEAEAALQTAASAGLKVVLTLEPPMPGVKLDATPTAWVNLQARSDYARGLREMAQRLAPLRPHIWAYELANEPHEIIATFGNVASSQYRHLAIELIEAVRLGEARAQVSASDKSWIVYSPGLFGTADWPYLYGQMIPLPDTRVIYSDHFYEPFNFTHQNIQGFPPATAGSRPHTLTPADIRGRLQPLGNFTSRTGAGTFLGEFGAVVWAGWSPLSGGTACVNEPWQPRRDNNNQAVYDNVDWLRDVVQAANDLGMAWTQFSFRTFEGWDSEFFPVYGPCGPYSRTPNNPTAQFVKQALHAP